MHVRPEGVTLPTAAGVRAVHQAVSVALIARGEPVAAARAEVLRLRDEVGHAEARADRLGEAWVAYLAAVRRYADQADELLTAKHTVTPDETKALSDQLVQVAATWQSVTGEPLDPAFFAIGRQFGR